MAKRVPKSKSSSATSAKRQRVLTEESVLEVLRKKAGNLAEVAKAFKVTRGSVWEYCERRPELKQAVTDARNSIVDYAESSWLRAAKRGLAWAVILAVKVGRVDQHGKSDGKGDLISVAALSNQPGLVAVNVSVTIGDDGARRVLPAADAEDDVEVLIRSMEEKAALASIEAEAPKDAAVEAIIRKLDEGGA